MVELFKLDTYGKFDGRIGRRTWWLGQLIICTGIWIPVLLCRVMLDLTANAGAGGSTPSLVGKVVSIAIMLPAIVALYWGIIALHVKRWHDQEKTWRYIFLIYVPIVNIWAFLKLGFLRGTVGPNRFGPDPLAKT